MTGCAFAGRRKLELVLEGRDFGVVKASTERTVFPTPFNPLKTRYALAGFAGFCIEHSRRTGRMLDSPHRVRCTRATDPLYKIVRKDENSANERRQRLIDAALPMLHWNT